MGRVVTALFPHIMGKARSPMVISLITKFLHNLGGVTHFSIPLHSTENFHVVYMDLFWQLKAKGSVGKSEVTYRQIRLPILRICALHFIHPSAHTQQ